MVRVYNALNIKPNFFRKSIFHQRFRRLCITTTPGTDTRHQKPSRSLSLFWHNRNHFDLMFSKSVMAQGSCLPRVFHLYFHTGVFNDLNMLCEGFFFFEILVVVARKFLKVAGLLQSNHILSVVYIPRLLQPFNDISC